MTFHRVGLMALALSGLLAGCAGEPRGQPVRAGVSIALSDWQTLWVLRQLDDGSLSRARLRLAGFAEVRQHRHVGFGE